MVLCLEVFVAFLIQVSFFHDPVGNKTVSKNPGNFQFFSQFAVVSKNPGCLWILASAQAHWTDLDVYTFFIKDFNPCRLTGLTCWERCASYLLSLGWGLRAKSWKKSNVGSFRFEPSNRWAFKDFSLNLVKSWCFYLTTCSLSECFFIRIVDPCHNLW